MRRSDHFTRDRLQYTVLHPSTGQPGNSGSSVSAPATRPRIVLWAQSQRNLVRGAYYAELYRIESCSRRAAALVLMIRSALLPQRSRGGTARPSSLRTVHCNGGLTTSSSLRSRYSILSPTTRVSHAAGDGGRSFAVLQSRRAIAPNRFMYGTVLCTVQYIQYHGVLYSALTQRDDGRALWLRELDDCTLGKFRHSSTLEADQFQ